ncbi:MAG: hypothetical protein AABW92_04545 [Nanoarchaeota archaeon]
MDYILLLVVGLGIVAGILFLKAIKKLLKLLFLAITIILLITAVFGYFFIKDVKDIAADFSEEKTIIFFTKQNQIITGLTRENNKTIIIERKNLGNYNEYYASQNYEEMLGEDERLLFLEVSNLEETNNTNLLFKILEQRIPALNITDKIAEKVSDKETANIILQIVDNIKQDPSYVFKAYKEDKLVVYPETLVFKTIKYFMKKSANSTQKEIS